MPEPREDGCALVTGASRASARRSRVRWPPTAGPSASTTAPTGAGADAVVAAIEAAGGRAMALGGDVADPARPDELFGALEAHFGARAGARQQRRHHPRRPHPLARRRGLGRGDRDQPDRGVPPHPPGAAADDARPPGRIVNVSSVVGLRANPGQANYAAAKAGLIALTKTSAVEVARRGITVNAVAPGLIETDMTAGASADLVEHIPARRAGTPEEVAACVRFLASDAASYVTGAVLSVDGGLAA